MPFFQPEIFYFLFMIIKVFIGFAIYDQKRLRTFHTKYFASNHQAKSEKTILHLPLIIYDALFAFI